MKVSKEIKEIVEICRSRMGLVVNETEPTITISASNRCVPYVVLFKETNEGCIDGSVNVSLSDPEIYKQFVKEIMDQRHS